MPHSTKPRKTVKIEKALLIQVLQNACYDHTGDGVLSCRLYDAAGELAKALGEGKKVRVIEKDQK